MAQKVVAHFIDHHMVKGTSFDVDIQKPVCHVRTEDQGTVEVDITQLKALYFVKDFGGNPKYDETNDPAADDIRLRGSTQINITFQDGEQLGGLTNRYPPRGPQFFVLPMDPKSNNTRILINRDAVASIEVRQPESAAPSPEASPTIPRPRRSSWVFDGKDIKTVHPDER